MLTTLSSLLCICNKFYTLCVLTSAPDSTKEEELPVAAAVNSKPLKSYQISDPALLDGPPEQVRM